jgi:hypothetical protein
MEKSAGAPENGLRNFGGREKSRKTANSRPFRPWSGAQMENPTPPKPLPTLPLELKPFSLRYAVFIKPGDVWYIEAIDIVRVPPADIEHLISKIRNASDNPKIRSPSRYCGNFGSKEIVEFDCTELDELLNGLAWEERLRVHHALGVLLFENGMSQWIYCQFHRHLRLGCNFATAQCAEAWIKISNRNHHDISESYISSPLHLVFKQERGGQYAVFKKTAFVQSRLDAMAEEDRLKAESEEAQRVAELAEQLRRSRFTTFVYLMEDPRNGAFKIGRSQAPGIRERTLQSEVPETLLRFSIPAEEKHEKELHALFQHRRIRGEWFGLSPNDLLEAITFLKQNGDAERASGDFHWLGRLFASFPPSQ